MRKFVSIVSVIVILSFIARPHCCGFNFSLPDVPDSLKTPNERIAYVIDNYWSGINFSTDTLTLPSLEFEQAFADFVFLSEKADSISSANAIKKLMSSVRTNPTALEATMNMAEKYLYELDSPMNSDILYEIFLNEYLALDNIDQAHRIRPRIQLEAVTKNRAGARVSDFNFLTADNKASSLYEIPSDKNILLIFYDPECDHCMEVLGRINTEVNDDAIRTIAIYSGDDYDKWSELLPALPEQWIIGYDDGTLQDEGLFIIRQLPTIFLLKGDKTVILKEPNIETLIQTLSNTNS